MRNSRNTEGKTSKQLIDGIIVMNTKTNEIIGNKDFPHIPARSTLQTKKKEDLQCMYEHAWDMLRYTLHEKMDAITDPEFDKVSIEFAKNLAEKQLEEAYKAYSEVVKYHEENLNNILYNIVQVTPHLSTLDVDFSKLELTINGSENLDINYNGVTCPTLHFYRRHSWDDKETPEDGINYGTIGTFKLDSKDGQVQLLMLGLNSVVTSPEFRGIADVALDVIHEANKTNTNDRNLIDKKLQDALDDILDPYIAKILA